MRISINSHTLMVPRPTCFFCIWLARPGLLIQRGISYAIPILPTTAPTFTTRRQLNELPVRGRMNHEGKGDEEDDEKVNGMAIFSLLYPEGDVSWEGV